MGAIMEWKLNENADSIVWLSKNRDGNISVVVEGHTWKWPQDYKQVVFDHEPHVLLNNQEVVTDSDLGRKVMDEWEVEGRPTKECRDGNIDAEYVAAMKWASPAVIALVGREYAGYTEIKHESTQFNERGEEVI